mgnify:CR=1 FL=1
MKVIKEDVTYDMWLQMYKDTNVYLKPGEQVI